MHCVCSYKAVIFAIKFACTGKQYSSSWHVDAHSKCLCGKQGLEGQQMTQYEQSYKVLTFFFLILLTSKK